MVKKKEVKKDPVGDANQIMKLVKRTAVKMEDSMLNANQRKIAREQLDYIKEQVDRMEEVDEDYQNLPENRIESLKEELKVNDNLLQKNKEEHKIMVMIGLRGKGYPEKALMYDSLIEDYEIDLIELKMKVDSKCITTNPLFLYQGNNEWEKLQLRKTKKQLKSKTKILKELNQMVEEVENDITAQNGRVEARKIQIIEDLKALGVDDIPKEKKDQNYIG